MLWRSLSIGTAALAATLLLTTPASAQRAPGLSQRAAVGLRFSPDPSFSLSIHARSSRHAPHRVVHAPHRVWVPGGHELVARDVWVPARTRRVWVPPVVETRCDLWGRPRTIELAPGYWKEVVEPGRYERRHVRVWRKGHWELRR